MTNVGPVGRKNNPSTKPTISERLDTALEIIMKMLFSITCVLWIIFLFFVASGMITEFHFAKKLINTNSKMAPKAIKSLSNSNPAFDSNAGLDPNIDMVRNGDQQFIEAPNQNSETVNITKMHLALISLFITGFGVAGGWWAKSLQDMLRESDKRIKEFQEEGKEEKIVFNETKKFVVKNILQSAEIAIHQLMPNPAYTQQIPSGIVRGLRFLEDLLNPNEEASMELIESIGTSDNYVALLYANALYHIGLNSEDPSVLDILKETIGHSKRNYEIYLAAQYRMAMYYRQMGMYDLANEIYAKVSGDPKINNTEYRTWKIRMETGNLITELARSSFWMIENNQIILPDLKRPEKAGENRPMEYNVRYYLLKASARLRLYDKKHNRDAWWGSLLDGAKRYIMGSVQAVDERYQRIEDSSGAECRQSPYKCVDGYCIIMLENFRFCRILLKLYNAILQQDSTGTAGVLLQIRDEFQHMKNVYQEGFLHHVNEMMTTLPGTYQKTIYSENLEREVILERFKEEIDTLADNNWQGIVDRIVRPID